MKNTFTLAILLSMAGLISAVSLADDKSPVVLFNGQDFTGWTARVSVPEVKLEDVWSVAPGGVLVCKGARPDKLRGYIRTDRDDFENYTLTLQWRFPAGTPGGNSGVLVHTTSPGALNVWPRSMEAQLNHQNAGDIWVIGTTCEIANAEKRVVGRRHYNLTDNSERPIGEWNDYKVLCKANEITIWVNGDLVNHVTNCSQSKGAICLQAEGADIEFRNILFTPLK